MPISPLEIGKTNAKIGTYQYTAKRLSGLRLVIPVAAGVTEVTNNRLVSIQQVNSTKELVAVIAPSAIASHTLVGFGVLEESLQGVGADSVSPTPNTFKDGDTVVVLRDPSNVYMIDVDPANIPVNGIGTAYMDLRGRLSSVVGGGNRLLNGAVFVGVPGLQLSGQLKKDTAFYQLQTMLEP